MKKLIVLSLLMIFSIGSLALGGQNNNRRDRRENNNQTERRDSVRRTATTTGAGAIDANAANTGTESTSCKNRA